MTRAEAIEILYNEIPGCGEKVTYKESERCEAYTIAITALREQEQEEQGCEWCDDFQKDPHFYVSEGNGQYTDVVFKFCPMCGKRLGD